MLRHNHISGDDESVLFADSLQREYEEVPGFGHGEIRETMVATEGEEMRRTGPGAPKLGLLLDRDLRHPPPPALPIHLLAIYGHPFSKVAR